MSLDFGSVNKFLSDTANVGTSSSGGGNFLGGLWDTITGNAGNIVAGAAGLAATNAAINQGKGDLQAISNDLMARSGVTGGEQSLAQQISGGTQFKPFTVTSGAGTGTFGDTGLALSQDPNQQALQRQASGMMGDLGQGIQGLGNLGYNAFTQANQAMRTDSGLGAERLGSMYGQMGQQQIASAQSPAELQRLQTAMTTQGLTASGQPSQGLLGLQNLAGQASFNGGSADVTGAFSGISAPNVNNVAGGIGQQATQGMNFGAQAQDVSGMFGGVSGSPFQTGTTQAVQNQAMGGVAQAGQFANVGDAFAGVNQAQFSGNAGQLANQALGQADLGAQAQNVQGAFAGIEAPSVRTGSGEFGSGLLAQAQQALQGETPTAQGLFEQIRATQQPEEERQRIALENRLAAQGRLGVSTAAYGGTPEQLAMEKAQAEARNNASYQAIQQADQLATSQQARAAQLGQMGLSAEQVQAQLDSEGFGQQMQLGQSRLSEAQTQEALQSSVQQRQAQLAQLGLSADQIQNQLASEGFSQQMQMGQAGLQTAQTQSALQSEAQSRATQLQQLGLSAEQVQNQLLSEGFSQDMALAGANLQAAQSQSALQSEMQNRQSQLAQLGLSAQQIQSQLESEGFSRQMQLGQANIGAQQAQSQLDSESQNRASQLAQLGMSAEQIASQLQSEGLSRQQSSAQLASQIAQTGAGISAQQQQLGQSMLGLGLQSQELGGQLNMQDLARAQGMFGMGQQSAMMPSQLEGQQLANITQALSASGIPLQQQLATLSPAIQQAQLQQASQLAGVNALSQLGTNELGMLKELGLGGATLDQELLRAISNIFVGGGSQ